MASADESAKFVRNKATARAHNMPVRKTLARAFFPKNYVCVCKDFYVIDFYRADKIANCKCKRDFAFYSYVSYKRRQGHYAKRHINAPNIQPLHSALKGAEYRLFVVDKSIWRR